MLIEKLIGDLGDKKRYRAFKARTQKLPAEYRSVLEAVEHYVYYFASSKPEHLLALLDDLADVFEEAAASGTSIRDLVGEDPVEFAEAFLRNYPEGSWIGKERARLTDAVDRAAASQAESGPR
ncbi:DNA-binding ferritin-like protein (Dps family) [Rathayibacter oskolensis]|uniref:DNA-binding ferritin-like protein (Dps family) n=1 Tax=Rathayibacter oskolensis TaxID=1891671 RepID=A0A1X7PHK7_9MICO|nr:DUF1048 domain-containing protein [Rathayibacter oskolensis]SMH50283.1 DNA-binding ferritin-like protein (Dps family) [Rathayibacter oskolensis]